MVGNAKAADSADRLGECADDEVALVEYALGFGDAAAMAYSSHEQSPFLPR
jgi:hypothetical protein